MVDENISPDADPLPPGDRLPLFPLFFAICAAPVAWTILHLIAYPLTSYACYPKNTQLLAPVRYMTWVRPSMIALGLAMLALALAGGWVSWRCLQLAKRTAADEGLAPLETGGRSRYFAICGLLTTVLFVGAIIFDLIMLVGATLCGY
jgi:hypothetical protein